MDKKQCNSCGKPKCSCKNKEFTKAVIEIDNPEQITLMRRMVIPASMGDDTAVPPVVGKYHNVLLYYEANHKSYLYSSDGIPTLLANGLTDYEQAVNLPEINGHTLLGDQSSADLGLQDEIANIEQFARFFDTVADMKASEDLEDGDYARTGGYHSIGDGGGSLYKIRVETGDDVVDNGSIIELGHDNLVAELIPSNKVVPEQFGAYGDGTHDDLTYLNAMEAYCKKTGVTMGGTSSAVYGVSDSFIIRTGYATDFNLATIKALNIMQAVVRHQKIRQGDSLTESVTNEYTSNMVIDCDGKADYGFYQDGWCWSTLVENIKVLNPLEIGIYIFKGSVRMFTCRVEQMDKTRHCVGLQVDSVDSEFYTIITRDCSTGICVKGEGNTFNSCHPSLFRPALIDGSKGFDLYKYASLINCVPDTYHYGIYVRHEMGFTAVNCHNLIATEWYDAEGAATEAPYFIYSTTNTVTYSQKISLYGCWMNDGAVYQGEWTRFSNFVTWSGASIRLNNPRMNTANIVAHASMPKEIRQPTSVIDITDYLQISKTANAMSVLVNGNTLELNIQNLALTAITQDTDFDLFDNLPVEACPSTAHYFLTTTVSGVLCRITFNPSKIQIRPYSGNIAADDKLWINQIVVK